MARTRKDAAPSASSVPSEQPEPEHVDVLIVGAGLSGVGAAARLRRDHPGLSLALLEGRDAIGGTWDLFRYPGVRSDSDMYTLGYAAKPWTGEKSIADGDSILAYIRETAAETGVAELVRYGHRVEGASWSSEQGRWRVTARRGAETVELSCTFLYVCAGYYRYDEGYTPVFAGTEDYAGQLVHPQHWPADLDWTGKRVVVIGSGATAVTLVPALAERAAQVTMLQRSPTYIISLPNRDPLSRTLGRVLPASAAARAVRWKNIRITLAGYQLSRKAPKLVRRALRRQAASLLPAGYDVARHFTPRYEPWDQRLCVVPDGDLYRALGSGRAQVVTDTIDRFTARGIRLASGTELEADVVVTATGLNLLAFGGLRLDVDGAPVELADTVAYKGLMLSGVPNFAFTIGYVNASWTLKADLVAEYVSRLLPRLLPTGGGSGAGAGAARVSVPVAPAGGGVRPLIDLTSGYVQRGIDVLPKQGADAPWVAYQNYLHDVKLLRDGPLDDAGMRFLPVGVPVAEAVTAGQGDGAPEQLTVAGRSVRHRVTGPADGAPVLLLHGINRSLEDWDEQHERLAAAGYRVHSLDLPGFGWSEPLPDTPTLAGLARAAADYLDAAGVTGPVRVVGNSLGGAVAMRLAVQRPERVHSLVLVSSAGFGREVTWLLRVLGIRPLGRALLRRPNRQGSLRSERAIFHDPSFATEARVRHAMRLAALPHHNATLLGLLRELGDVHGVFPEWRAELLPQVAALKLPTLVLWGDRDAILPAAHLDAARGALPHAHTRLLPATGHMAQIERPDAFAEAAVAFWQTVPEPVQAEPVALPQGREELRENHLQR